MAAVASDRTAQYGYTGLAPAGSQAEYQSQPHNLGLPQGLARNNASDGGPIAPLNTNQAKLSSSPRPGLPPVKTPLAITPTYIRHSSIETTLILTRKLPTKYTVITKEREPIFHIDTEELSVHNTKTVYDAKLDTMQFQIKERQSTSETQMYVKLHDSDARVMNVGKEKQGMYLGTFDNVAIVGRGGKLVGIGEECIYVKDDKTEGWGTTGQSIIRNKANDQVIAIVNRANGNTVPEYTVTIAPCVDMALILAFCVSMDLKWKEMEKSDAESVAHGLDIVSSIMQIAGGGG